MNRGTSYDGMLLGYEYGTAVSKRDSKAARQEKSVHVDLRKETGGGGQSWLP